MDNTTVKLGKRIYVEENGGKKQSWINWFIAIISLFIVCGWYHILFTIIILSFYSKIALSIKIYNKNSNFNIINL